MIEHPYHFQHATTKSISKGNPGCGSITCIFYRIKSLLSNDFYYSANDSLSADSMSFIHVCSESIILLA